MIDEPRRDDLEAIWEEVDRRSHGYLDAPLPAPLDAALGTVVERYADGDEQTREAIRDGLTLDAARALAVYAERMASQAVHDDSSAALLSGLVALGMAAAREYEKELMVVLPLFDRSARTIKIDPDALFEHATAILARTLRSGFASSRSAAKPSATSPGCATRSSGRRTGCSTPGTSASLARRSKT